MSLKRDWELRNICESWQLDGVEIILTINRSGGSNNSWIISSALNPSTRSQLTSLVALRVQIHDICGRIDVWRSYDSHEVGDIIAIAVDGLEWRFERS